jgi:hypothetical protein
MGSDVFNLQYRTMQRVILDSETRSKLGNLEQFLELYDESGRIVG